MTVFQSALCETTSTVVEGASWVLVVDPAWLPHEVTEIRSYVASVRRGRPLYCLFTHSDWDHIIGAGAFPDAIQIGSKELAERSDWQQVIDQIHRFDNEYYLRRPYPIEYPALDIVVDHDRQQAVLCADGGGPSDACITFWLSPGHTRCGLLCAVEPHGVLLVGDYLSDVEVPFISAGSDAYLHTLGKLDRILADHDVRLLVPGHGQSTTSRAEMRRRVSASRAYIEAVRSALRAEQSATGEAGAPGQTQGQAGATGQAEAEADAPGQAEAEALARMVAGYPFADGMRAQHEQNLALLRQEQQQGTR